MSANRVGTQSLSARDVRGHLGRVRFHIAYDNVAPADGATQALAVCNAIAAVFGSNLSITSYRGPFSQDGDPAVYPSPGAGERFIDAEDKLAIIYLCGPAGGLGGFTRHRMLIPAPLGANFVADDETVTAAAQTALSTAFKSATVSAIMCNSVGNPVQHVLGGQLVRGRFARKETIYSKLPDLSGFQL